MYRFGGTERPGELVNAARGQLEPPPASAGAAHGVVRSRRKVLGVGLALPGRGEAGGETLLVLACWERSLATLLLGPAAPGAPGGEAFASSQGHIALDCASSVSISTRILG